MYDEIKERILEGLERLPEQSYNKRLSYLIEEKKLNDEKINDYEIREKLGKIQNVLSREWRVYFDINKFLEELIALYKKKIPQNEPIQTENITKKEADLPKKALNKSSFETPTNVYSPQELPNLGDCALMQVYLSLSGEGESVTNANKEEIAKKYDCHPKRLYEEYNNFQKPNARTEEAGSERKNKAKADRFNRVIKLLQPFPEALKRATDEQKIFIVASQKSYD